MKGPDFFIAGAPKSGTTALAHYLSAHPGIFFSDPKEPQYFTFDYPGHRGAATLNDYLALFRAAPERALRAGEGSVWYLYSRAAGREIRRRFPDARIVLLLRRPDEMAISLYVQQRRMGIENAPSFAHAWQWEAARRKGLRIPVTCRTPEFLFYGAVARYGEQIERLYGHFPRDRVKVFLYEDFACDPGQVYRDVIRFLGLTDDGRDYFPVVNPHSDVRSAKMQIAIGYGVEKLRALRARAMARYGVDLAALGIHRAVIGGVRYLNKRTGPARPVAEDLKKAVREHYRDDILKLERLLGRDLSHWLGC